MGNTNGIGPLLAWQFDMGPDRDDGVQELLQPLQAFLTLVVLLRQLIYHPYPTNQLL